MLQVCLHLFDIYLDLNLLLLLLALFCILVMYILEQIRSNVVQCIYIMVLCCRYTGGTEDKILYGTATITKTEDKSGRGQRNESAG